MSLFKFFSVIVTSAFIVCTSQAAIIPVGGDGKDTTIGLDSDMIPHVLWAGGATGSTGGASYASNGGDTVCILVFALPDLGGESIQTAELTFDGYRQWENTWGVDLYGVRSAAANTVLVDDYSYGPSASGTLIQNDIMTPSNSLLNEWQSVSTDDGGDAALASWLSAQYSAVGAGGFVFLRLNSDDPLTNDVNTYKFGLSEATAQTPPVLTITTVPEPASLALLAIGGLMAIKRR